MHVYVIDTETTGLDGIPDGELILEIAVCRVNPAKKKVTLVLNQVVGHAPEQLANTPDGEHSWIFWNSSLTPAMVYQAKPEAEIAPLVRDILKDQLVTCFNTSFDFNRFLRWKPWEIKKPFIAGVLPCIMLSATDACKIPSEYYPDSYKWPKLEEAHAILCPEKVKLQNEEYHRAATDCVRSSEVLLALIEKGVYKLPEPAIPGQVTLSETRLDVLRIVKEQPGITVRELSQIRNVREPSTNRLLKKMVEEGLLVRETSSRGLAGSYHYYANLGTGGQQDASG